MATGIGGRGHLVVFPHIWEEVEREDHGDRAGLAAAGDPERVVDQERDLRLVLDLQDRLADRPEDRGVWGRMDLERRGPGVAGRRR